MSFLPATSSRNQQFDLTSSPQIFFRQAPHPPPIDSAAQDDHLQDRFDVHPDNLFSSESPSTEPDTPIHSRVNLSEYNVMDNKYRRHSLSSDCTRRSMSIQDEHFTPVRNLAILNYQRRSIFSSPRQSSESTVTESSFGLTECWPCSSSPWKGHERFCFGFALAAILLIVVGGIVGIYFALRDTSSYASPASDLLQHSPRIGVRVGADGGATGNELIPFPSSSDNDHSKQKDAVSISPPVSEFDASLGELDCNELYTFRCGVNQCLPISLWCDGKADCDDRTDEPEECALNCPPRFYACLNHSTVRFDKTHDWCIPETLVCNSVPDCGDLSDEYACRCTPEQIRCTDGICKNRTEICRGADACSSDTSEPLHCNCLDDLAPHKFCDGFPDCADNLDEIECSTNCDVNDQFSCWRSGYGCVHRTSTCDGIRDCANGEDEEECLRLLADDESLPDTVDYVGLSRPAGILLVRRWGSDFSPVCVTADFDFQADSYIGTTFCNHFGYARLLYAEPLILPKSTPSSSTKFYVFNPQATSGDPSRHFIPVKQCQSGSVLRIHCTEMMCEPRVYRNKGVVVTENGELVLKRQEQYFPFIAQIYKRVWSSWVLRCSGVIVHPLYLITSSGCIDKNGYFKALSGPYWQSTNPKLMQSRDISMIAMPPENFLSQGRSEIVLARLDKRLGCHDFLRPICLPDPIAIKVTPSPGAPTNLTASFSHCVTLGWNVTANRAASIPYPSELHIARDIQIVPTEDCSRLLWSKTPEPLDSVICVRISSRENTNLLSDPGGVLVCSTNDASKWELMGVLASYKTRVTGNYVRVYALYSRLDQHLSWILREFTESDTLAP